MKSPFCEAKSPPSPWRFNGYETCLGRGRLYLKQTFGKGGGNRTRSVCFFNEKINWSTNDDYLGLYRRMEWAIWNRYLLVRGGREE